MKEIMQNHFPVKKVRRFFLSIRKSISHKLFTTSVNENTLMVVIALAVGLVAGLGAVGIHYGIEFFKEVFWGAESVDVDYYYSLNWYTKLIIPTVTGFVVGLIIHFVAKEAKGHGVPEVMEAIALRNGVIRKRVAAAKLLASSICIGGGGSVGREGPVIQIGSAIGSFFGQILQLSVDRVKTLVACGAAAGIAAAFNAPIAGALFSAEIILGEFGVAQLSPVIIAAVSATVVSHVFLGDKTTFSVPDHSIVSLYEFLPYLCLGLLAGLVALLFIKTLHRSELFFEKMRIPVYLKTSIGGLVIGIMGCFIPHIFGVGYDTMDKALNGGLTWQLLSLLVFAKIIATSVSLGSGGSGGVFAPSLFLGAALGGAFGDIVHQLFPAYTASSGAYAIIGMGAVVAATTHAPVAAILIIFEMTNDYHIILPLMLASTVALLFRATIFKESIYTIKLVARGVNIHKGKEQNVLRGIKVSEVLDRHVETIPSNLPLRSLMEKILERPNDHFFVVDKEQNFIGTISLKEIQQALHDRAFLGDFIVAHDLANSEAPTIYENETLDKAMDYFGQHHVDILPVFRENGPTKIIGQIALQAVIDSYNNEISKMDVSADLASSIKSFDKTKNFDLVKGFTFAEIRIPTKFVGKSLVELNLRKEYEIQVIFIKRLGLRQREMHVVPTPAEVLHEGDRLIVLGPESSVLKFKKL